MDEILKRITEKNQKQVILRKDFDKVSRSLKAINLIKQVQYDFWIAQTLVKHTIEWKGEEIWLDNVPYTKTPDLTIYHKELENFLKRVEQEC
jgi:hypothetical protein